MLQTQKMTMFLRSQYDVFRWQGYTRYVMERYTKIAGHYMDLVPERRPPINLSNEILMGMLKVADRVNTGMTTQFDQGYGLFETFLTELQLNIMLKCLCYMYMIDMPFWYVTSFSYKKFIFLKIILLKKTVQNLCG